jgi:thioredoxin 1
MSSICIEITDANFEAEVAKSPLPIVIDFWAVWCGPCRAVAPHFESLAQEYAGRVRFGKCDVDVNQEIAARYDVRGVPMFLAFRDGKVVAQQLGAGPRAKLEDLAKKALAAPAAASGPSAQPSRAA